MTPTDRVPPRVPGRLPGPAVLLVAAALVAGEALAVLAVGTSVVLGSDRSRLVLDVTTTLFFALYGAGLLVSGWGLLRARRWARAPVVLAQLIQVLVAWSFLSGTTRWVGVLLIGSAAAVLAAVLSPPATRSLVGDDAF